MVAKIQKLDSEPPDWWGSSLYDFLKDPKFPLMGWVWEFMRRYRLKKLFKVEPVEAMKPDVQPRDVPAGSCLLNLPWPVIISNFQSFILLTSGVDHKWREKMVQGGAYSNRLV
jgi:hypothetical protein